MRHLSLAAVVFVACDTADDPEFSRIDNQSSARLVLVEEQDWEVDDSHVWHLDCGAGWDEDVELRVEDDVLILASTGDNDGDCEARVVTAHLDALTVSGDGDLDCDHDVEIDSLDIEGNGEVQLGTVRTDHLDLNARGNGAVHIDELHTDHLWVELSGTGDMWLAGETDTADVSIHGDGSLHAEDLLIENLTIDLTGSGSATVHVTGSVSGEVGGSGDLEIVGDPDSDVTESGAGTIVWL